jgi:hypothetical protein
LPRFAPWFSGFFQPKDFLLTGHDESNRRNQENGAESGFAGEIAAMQLY